MVNVLAFREDCRLKSLEGIRSVPFVWFASPDRRVRTVLKYEQDRAADKILTPGRNVSTSFCIRHARSYLPLVSFTRDDSLATHRSVRASARREHIVQFKAAPDDAPISGLPSHPKDVENAVDRLTRCRL